MINIIQWKGQKAGLRVAEKSGARGLCIVIWHTEIQQCVCSLYSQHMCLEYDVLDPFLKYDYTFFQCMFYGCFLDIFFPAFCALAFIMNKMTHKDCSRF